MTKFVEKIVTITPREYQITWQAHLSSKKNSIKQKDKSRMDLRWVCSKIVVKTCDIDQKAYEVM